MLNKSVKSISYLITSTTGLLSLQELFIKYNLYILLLALLITTVTICIAVRTIKRKGTKSFFKSSVFSWVVILFVSTMIISLNSYLNYKSSMPMIGPPDFQYEPQITKASLEENSKDPYGKLTNGYYYYTVAPHNYKEAKKWFQEAAKDDVPEAFYYLGCMYYNGDGVERDYNTALSHFKSAAKLNHIAASYRVALMYHDGLGTKVDYNKAIKYLSIPALVDSMGIQEKLAELYMLTQNKDSANYWYFKAASQGSTEALSELIFNHFGQDCKEDENDATLKTITKGFKTSTKLAMELVEKDKALGHYYLGVIEDICGKDKKYLEKAVEHYLISASLGNPDSQLKLAIYYSGGIENKKYNVPRNLDEAIKWCKYACDSKNKEAMKLLPVLLERKMNESQ